MNSLSKKSVEEDFEINNAMWTNPNIEIYKDFEFNVDTQNRMTEWKLKVIIIIKIVIKLHLKQ